MKWNVDFFLKIDNHTVDRSVANKARAADANFSSKINKHTCAFIRNSKVAPGFIQEETEVSHPKSY